jgi:3',5'-cyclic AMP phosphodiesterase CpdA
MQESEDEDSVSLLVVADLGIGPSAQPTIGSLRNQAKSRHFDALLHLGDIAYELDSLQPGISRAYFGEMEEVTSRLPYMVLPGNHEKYRNFEQYKAEFRMPRNWANGGNSMFYSFNLGLGHFIAISTEETLFGPASASKKQLEWLRKDLLQACSHREAVPWIILLAHRPFYCNMDFSFPANSSNTPHSNEYCGRDALKLRSEVEDLLYEARVDLVLTGHVHNYQRMQPLYHNTSQARKGDGMNWHMNPTAPVYIVTGTGGSSKGSDYVSATPQPWTQVQLRETSYSVLRLLNATHLYWEQISSLSQELLDFVWLIKF